MVQTAHTQRANAVCLVRKFVISKVIIHENIAPQGFFR